MKDVRTAILLIILEGGHIRIPDVESVALVEDPYILFSTPNEGYRKAA